MSEKNINEAKIEKTDQELIDKVNELLEYGYPIKEIAEKTGVTVEFVILNAKKALYLMRDYPEAVRLMELRDKAIWDEVSRTNGAVKQEKFDIALKMLEEGISIETVVKITGLALEEISHLRH